MVNQADEWYSSNRPVYEAFSKKIEDLLRDILTSKDIPSHAIEARAKKIDSFKKKAEKGINYDYKEMQDLAGIRIIGLVSTEVEKITEEVRKLFIIDEKLSTDKAKALKNNEVGYHSVHLVGRLTKEREELPEWKPYKGLCFEIQIRTILQHSWAEIEHDRGYKFSGNLPDPIIRKFALIAGLLEIADNEFVSVTQLVEEYSKEVSVETKLGNLKIQLNSTSLEQYLLEKYKAMPGMEAYLKENKASLAVLSKALSEINILRLDQLDKIIPKNFGEVFLNHYKDVKDYGFLSKLIVILYPDLIFKGTNSDEPINITDNAIKFYKNFNINIVDLCKKYKIKVILVDE